jgi:hypothetical protein
MAEEEGSEHRRSPRLRLALPVEAQVGGGGFRNVQIVDISPTGIQLWCDDIEDLDTQMGAGKCWSSKSDSRRNASGHSRWRTIGAT